MTRDLVKVWRIPPEADLHHRAWDGEHVFFHGAAGDTYRLSEAASAVLLRLMEGPADELALVRDLFFGDEAETQAALADLLAELLRLECVEQAP